MQLNWLIHHTERCLFPLPYMHHDVHQSVCACGVGSPFFFLLSGSPLIFHPRLSVRAFTARLTDWLTWVLHGGQIRVRLLLCTVFCMPESIEPGYNRSGQLSFSPAHRFMTRCIKLSHSTGRLCIVTDYRMSSALWTWMSAYILLLSFYWLQSADIIAILSTP